MKAGVLRCPVGQPPPVPIYETKHVKTYECYENAFDAAGTHIIFILRKFVFSGAKLNLVFGNFLF